MLDSNFSPNAFLTEAESLAVDQALLSAKEKFSTRVALYSLRVLQAIAPNQNDITAIAPEQILDWLTHHQSEMPAGLQPDPAFQQFFSQLVLSSLRPLAQIAMEQQKSVGELRSVDVIAWFEQQAKIRVEQGESATFWGGDDTPA
ncbi:MAG: hypothetical protein F6K30_15825 [Cyanothece sp. SIO2G6]|nr:hypothetical protein [Cyanothece sp. SIO2G6]